MSGQSLFEIPMERVTYDEVDRFLALLYREDTRIEYKASENGQTPESALESMTAMSNALGGIILIGVADANSKPKLGSWPSLPRAVGKTDQIDALLTRMAAQITPRPRIDLCFVAPDDSPDKGVLLVRVEPGPRPPYWCKSKGIVIRHGDQDRVADLATIEFLLERRTGGNYAVQQAADRNWFAPLPGLTTTDWSVVMAVVGPTDPVARKPLARALDGQASTLLFDSRVLFWEGVSGRTHTVAFGEDYVHFLVRIPNPPPEHTIEMHAYSDGVTRWRIPLHSMWWDPSKQARIHESDKFSNVTLVTTLFLAAVLGFEWMTKAIPDYQGALSFEVEVHNLHGKSMRCGASDSSVVPVSANSSTWRGAFTLLDQNVYLPELKLLCYRFLRSIQAPVLEEESNSILEMADRHWRGLS